MGCQALALKKWEPQMNVAFKLKCKKKKGGVFLEYTHRCGQQGFSNTADFLVATAAKVTNSN